MMELVHLSDIADLRLPTTKSAKAFISNHLSHAHLYSLTP